MPTYDFQCTQCGYQHELLQSMNAPPPDCPTCGDCMKQLIRTAPTVHGGAAFGREQAVRSLPQCGKGCSCCP
ncbi:FmdB family zinc ribbon protein [Solemya elarraichensis gill symbiont]|uniref:FmdB family zinc ribbon protein n=1 Tax=Solemya elarraichensis gill symbiont TaxID=1918949 RepID=UPI000997B6DD